jgi:glucosyl-3-phosphoglycerate synthase
MGDFHQNGIVTTLHNLNDRPLAALETELEQYARQRPLGLILPSLYSELEGPALADIVQALSQVPYLGEIIIGLDQADETQYRKALDFFSVLPQRHRVLWNDGPRMQAITAALREHDLAPEQPGKGRNVWYCLGYSLASGRSGAIALHDCDILTYERDLLARLIYPVAHPAFNYQFCKGYYSRVTDTAMNGRVCRLLVTPLIRALQKLYAPMPYLDYLDSFRYALAGEFSFRSDVVSDLRIPVTGGSR